MVESGARRPILTQRVPAGSIPKGNITERKNGTSYYGKLPSWPAWRWRTLTLSGRAATKWGWCLQAGVGWEKGERHSRNEEVDETVFEDETSEPAAALDGGIGCRGQRRFGAAKAGAGQTRGNQAEGAQREHDEVKCHGVNECGGEDGVVGLLDDTTASLWGPYSLEEDTLQDEGPVTQNEDDQKADDQFILRPDSHSAG